MKKMFSLLLALILVVSLIPMVVSAASYQRIDGAWYVKNSGGDYIKVTDGEVLKELEAGYLAQQSDLVAHEPEQHTWGVGYNTKYHWLQCGCGHKISMERHIDPKDAKDDYCTCGYHFSDNADLVTLWVDGCPPIKDFDKNKTEYELKAYTYKDVKEIKIATHTYDSEATVELPEDLSLKEGKNTFEVKVTAENQKVTKTYTITVIKEASK